MCGAATRLLIGVGRDEQGNQNQRHHPEIPNRAVNPKSTEEAERLRIAFNPTRSLEQPREEEPAPLVWSRRACPIRTTAKEGLRAAISDPGVGMSGALSVHQVIEDPKRPQEDGETGDRDEQG